MKAFLEEYGMIVIVCIAVAVLVALAVWTGNKTSASSTSSINGFANEASSVLNQYNVHGGSSESVTNAQAQ